MKKYFLSLIVIFIYLGLFSQKRLIDFSVSATWPILSPEQISSDGKYVSYSVSSFSEGTSLVIQATDRQWKKVLPNVTQSQITEDSRRLIFKVSGDSLGILDLERDSLRYIEQVVTFVVSHAENGQWLACLLKHPEKELIVVDLFTNIEKHYVGISGYKFSDNGQILVMQATASENNQNVAKILWLNLAKGELKTIGEGYSAAFSAFNKDATEFSFVVDDVHNGVKTSSLHYYEAGMDSSITLVDNSTYGMAGLVVSSGFFHHDIYFGPDGNKIFFGMEKPNAYYESVGSSNVKVELQNYLEDEYQQYEILHENGSFLGVVAVSGHGRKVIRLQNVGDSRFTPNSYDDNNVILFRGILGSKGTFKGKISPYCYDVFLVSTIDGSRKLIKRQLRSHLVRLSLTGKYVYWYDEVQNCWATYNVGSNIIKNITKDIRIPLSSEVDFPNTPSGRPYPVIGWLANDSRILIQDRHDIWQIDPDGKTPAVNLTNGYGRRHNIQFSYMDFSKYLHDPIRKGDTIMLSAFNTHTKKNGFFRLVIGQSDNPKQLVMESRMYFHQIEGISISGAIDPFLPLKAKRANVYLVERMSTTEYPNLYISTDFEVFKALSNLEPQKQYNWFTNELYHWKLPDGRLASGILYKPENFDPTKKYPVIFFYYEKNSDALNYFIHPELSNGPINIPWYLSNGYLVFIPDIYFANGHPGESAYSCVISAALSLSMKPFIEGNRMGLQGHSFGGFETNYIVSRTSLFAAAASAAGASDLLSIYGEKKNSPDFYENSQGRIGFMPWGHMQLYIENSPIFRADKVTTPILIVHNRDDPSVPFHQGLEWYFALTRLKKKAWMLTYDGEEHLINNQQNQLDYSIRLSQFFDHYLKGALPPKWMTQGGNSLDLDYSRVKPQL